MIVIFYALTDKKEVMKLLEEGNWGLPAAVAGGRALVPTMKRG